MSDEYLVTPPLSPKSINTKGAIHTTPDKPYMPVTVTTETPKMHDIGDGHVLQMSPSLESAVHALTTLKSEQRWSCGVKRKRTISSATEAAKPLKKRDMKKWMKDEPTRYEDIQFTTLKEAKDAFEAELHAIGVLVQNDTYTVRVMTDITDVPYYAVDNVKWLYVRCFYRKIDKFVRTKVIDIEPVINKRGSVRQVYNLSLIHI